MILLDGKKLALAQNKKLQQRIKVLRQKGIIPGLAVILVGQDPASAVYVRNKQRLCHDSGINFYLTELSQSTPAEQIKKKISELNKNKKVHGIIIQLPLPAKLDPLALISAIDPQKDVDGLHPMNMGLLPFGKELFVPATPKGVIDLLQKYKIPVVGKKAVVVGFGYVAGLPLSLLLARAKATVTIAQDKTKDLTKLLQGADIVVSAVGRPGLIKGEMIKAGATVIDVGVTKKGDKWVGDVQFASVSKKAKYLTPVPGGVGPLTVSALLDNVVTAAEY
ncbi:MAG: bifunctional 5,10-methylenetetrahydrofolate dehydrogenase/5,10-methenyltetrahydrofolate cyclohydrolase [Patescibacteria group bacterium]|jgi:methylenetetrahydrofolate dehydrogenase (NADP+)/methenyltetrahydrofolate cyclohydrolase